MSVRHRSLIRLARREAEHAARHCHMNAGCELFAPYYVPAGGPIASESMLNPAHIPTKTSAERLARPRCDNAPRNPVDEPACGRQAVCFLSVRLILDGSRHAAESSAILLT